MTNQDIEKTSENIFEHLLLYQVRAVFTGRRPSGKWRPDRRREENSALLFSPFWAENQGGFLMAKVKAKKIPSHEWRRQGVFSLPIPRMVRSLLPHL
ncbi:hypothetical protein QM467_00650 [Rhodoblastus sp. 17X3]|uniref:hypothetical protein n=1 Tax=Rhodoblastus sp. 17X3 TaxID=3047026 RepID=UPI0024B6FF19|nr:hypothetical protein [Rhodoblastus sp. 17X3]MDI9846560.1 hypothetical protein [Rhodoblastus sp. 17X3]